MSGSAVWAITPAENPGEEPLRELFIAAELDKVKAMIAVSKIVDIDVVVEIAGPVSARTIEILALSPGQTFNASA